jgi:hypothetical protein
MVTIQLSIPEDLADEANTLGLLEATALKNLIQKEIRRLRIEELFAAADDIASLGGEPMTPEQVEQEIRLARSASNAPRS